MNSKPLPELVKWRLETPEQNDIKVVQDKWPGAPYPCSDYFSRGRFAEGDRRKPIDEALVKLVQAAGAKFYCNCIDDVCQHVVLRVALQSLREACEKEGVK